MRASRVGELAIGRAAVLLKAEHAMAVDLVPIRHDPDEAGLIGATVFGIALANLHVPGIAELRRFKEALVVLLVSCLFVVLTADLDLTVLGKLSLPVIALTATTLFVVRPAALWLATWRSDLTWRERLFVGWIGPRGIVAAAVAGLAGPRLSEAGYAGGT